MSIQYAGGTNVNATFTGNVKADILSNVEAQLITAGWTLVQGNVPATVTVTIASPAVFSWTAHGLVAGTRIVFNTTGALPTGLTAASSVYFVIAAGLTANNFEVSTTLGGSAVNTSGSQSGTHTASPEILMQSATTAWSVATRIRFRDLGGSCITFSLENSTSVLQGVSTTGAGGYLQPSAGRTFRIIANRYQAFVFQPVTTVARAFVGFGTPYLPTFLQGVLTECGWMQCNSQGDADATLRPSMRTAMRPGPSQPCNHQCIANAVLMECAGQNNNPMYGMLGVLSPLLPPSGLNAGWLGIPWHDSSYLMLEPLLSWGSAISYSQASSSAQPLLRGQLWDCTLVCSSLAGDQTSTFDSHNWFVLTDNNSSEFSTLMVVVP